MIYKQFIVAIALLLIGTAFYFYKSAGISDLVVADIKTKGKTNYGVDSFAVFSGIYECTPLTGCDKKTRIFLEEDTTADVIEEVEGSSIDEVSKSLGQGTWGVGKDKSLVLLIQKTPGAPSTSIIAQSITTLYIKDFKAKNLFPQMTNPTFTRIKEVEKVVEKKTDEQSETPLPSTTDEEPLPVNNNPLTN